MKKFYAFAAAAMMAVSANAADVIYLCGNGEGLGWNPGEPFEVQLVDGKFTAEIPNLVEFKISTTKSADSEWAGYNEGALTCTYGDKQGVAVALEAGDANISAPWKGDYTIEVAGDLSTVTLTTSTPEPTGPADIYLRGDMNGWGAPDEWKLVEAGKNIYKVVLEGEMAIKAGNSFKVADADWGAINYGAAEGESDVFLDVEAGLVLKSNDNLTAKEECTGVVWVNLNEGSTYVLLTNDKDFVPEWGDNSAVATIAASNNVAVKYYNLQGVQVANPENGLFIAVKGDKVSKVLVK
ncbi:MAG: hypothetical protein K2J70_08160 [Muribaculaceae bacterium]|nr:hypothetical protein [Muribaculaceae bacterium]